MSFRKRLRWGWHVRSEQRLVDRWKARNLIEQEAKEAMLYEVLSELKLLSTSGGKPEQMRDLSELGICVLTWMQNPDEEVTYQQASIVHPSRWDRMEMEWLRAREEEHLRNQVEEAFEEKGSA